MTVTDIRKMEYKGASMIKFSCIILAGGNGTRFGTKKQFIEWNGKPLWEHVYDKCIQVSDDIQTDFKKYPHLGRMGAVMYGARKAKYPIVVILEAARPAVTVNHIEHIAFLAHTFDSVSYAIPSTDSLYDVSQKKHVNRKDIYQLQIPQAFNRKLLLRAFKLRNKKITYTSETILMQDALGIKPHLLPGDYNLWKVTYPSDLVVIKEMCKK